MSTVALEGRDVILEGVSVVAQARGQSWGDTNVFTALGAPIWNAFSSSPIYLLNSVSCTFPAGRMTLVRVSGTWGGGACAGGETMTGLAAREVRCLFLAPRGV
jgi:hypothetical protein